MRVHYVNTARPSKRERRCKQCGHAIAAGEAYKWAEPRYGPKLIWCKDHTPKRSELTSGKLGPIYDVIDTFETKGQNVDEVRADLEVVADAAREVAQEYQDSIDAMPESLQDTSDVAEDMRTKIEEIEGYADELESFDFDEDDPREDVDDPDKADEEEVEAYLDSLRDAAVEAVNDFPL